VKIGSQVTEEQSEKAKGLGLRLISLADLEDIGKKSFEERKVTRADLVSLYVGHWIFIDNCSVLPSINKVHYYCHYHYRYHGARKNQSTQLSKDPRVLSVKPTCSNVQVNKYLTGIILILIVTCFTLTLASQTRGHFNCLLHKWHNWRVSFLFIFVLK